ncbi:helix-turn-helix domain-containing protein [Nocardia sp. NBC_01329]|uniref:helix-turn-helix domain-containing protein n=1 Tax=Nocardia sp. NBC_01329 TaxID=2903594 RepID=UPI002E0D0EB6|nr:MerR family transcriptional regulator [Nocardia sp. NBC_01329]
MTYITYFRDAISIGEAARRSGVPVRTIRFYCDEGILTAHRTTGGHRMFTPDALTRLTLIRRLRAVGLGLAAITAVLADENTTRDAVTAERIAVEAELSELAWRHAVLRAIEEAGAGERAAVLSRLAGAAERGAARDVLVEFWRRILAAMPAGLFDDFVEMDVPAATGVPTPAHVLAIAELAELAREPELGRQMSRWLWLSDSRPVRYPRASITDLAAAHAGAAQRMHAGDDPEPGPELDLLVAAHAAARGRPDSAAFRRRLATDAAAHPMITRYWSLTAEAMGTRHTTGATQEWFRTALGRSLHQVTG